MDMRIDGINPKAKIPNPSEPATCSSVSLTIFHVPP